MLRENIEKDFEDIIKNHEINPIMLRDVCFAIVTADYLDGSNQKELNIDKFVSASSEQWKKILTILNVTKPKVQMNELPDVQKMRILCDALTIVTRGNVSETRLLSEVSSKIAHVMGVNLKAGSYKDIEDCYGVFDKYKVSKILDEDWIRDLDKKLLNLQKVFETFVQGISFSECIGSISVPISDLHFFREGSCDNTDDVKNYIYDKVIFNIEKFFALKFKESFSSDEVKCNSKLNKIRRTGSYMFGTRSIGNYAPTLEIRNGLPLYIRNKIDELFSTSKNYDINDLTNIVFCLCILLNNKMPFTLDKATSLLEDY